MVIVVDSPVLSNFLVGKVIGIVYIYLLYYQLTDEILPAT